MPNGAKPSTGTKPAPLNDQNPALSWFPCVTAEWEMLTRDQTLEQDGALFRLACRAWSDPIPCTVADSAAAFERILGTRWRKLESLVRTYFKPCDEHPGRLRWPRLYELYLRQLDKHQSAVQRGKMGGRPAKSSGESAAQTSAKSRAKSSAKARPQSLSREKLDGSSALKGREEPAPPALARSEARAGGANLGSVVDAVMRAARIDLAATPIGEPERAERDVVLDEEAQTMERRTMARFAARGVA